VRSQVESSTANENNTVAQSSAAPSRDFTVAATRKTGRPGSRHSESRRAGARRSHRTRIGKIARLPNEVREELNRRLQDGEPGEKLLKWLNALPNVRKILDAQFGGRPISKQNLSEWKLGGYRDWERAEEDRLCVDRLTERAAQVAGTDDESPLSERMAAVLLVEMAATFEQLKDASLPPAERWQLVRQMSRELAQMRREDNRAARLRIEQARWEWEEDKLQDEQSQRIRKAETARMCAGALSLELEGDLKSGTLGGHWPDDPVKPSPSKSGSRGARAESDRSDGSDRSDKPSGSSARVRRSRAQSNLVKAEPTSGAEETGRQDAGGPGSAEPNQPREEQGNYAEGDGRSESASDS